VAIDRQVSIRSIRNWPDLLQLHRQHPERYPCLLESVAHGTPQSRYDILFAVPGGKLVLDSSYQLHADMADEKGNDFLSVLDDWFAQEQTSLKHEEDLPFTSGWFLYLGYELAAQIEPTLAMPAGPANYPVACAIRMHGAIIRDRQMQRCYLVAETSHKQQLDDMLADIQQQAAKQPDITPVSMREDPAQDFLNGVERIKQYIYEGDVFQVNLSRAWHGEIGKNNPADLYHHLCQQNPAPFAGIANLPGISVISSSPERLVRTRQGQAETRPIAGTRPRDEQRNKDLELSGELLAHPKERAEHVMLIDLERNDLGRVCKPGSIRVDELMMLESYAHVHHIVSNIRGNLREQVTPGQVIRAVFPGGTITGCPKVRCMEIISELEKEARGAYTGSMGYLNLNGDMDLNILIRTMVAHNETITLRAGAGIVADSRADRELAETRSKAKGLLLALT
jgi:anthranilate synthase component 1